MELISIENTRLIELFVVAKTEGQLSGPQAIAKLVERYRFAGFPTKIEELSADSVTFKNGFFEQQQIDAFDIHRDGVVVASRTQSTVLDAFVKDLVEWARETFGLKRVVTHVTNNKNYESHIVVRTDAPVLGFLDKLAPVRKALAKSLKDATLLETEVQGVAFAINADQSVIPGMKPISLRLERRAGMPFTSGLYYSSAPLPTSEHMKLLRIIEELAT